MPIYEYRCEACGERFERWFASQDKASTTEVHCPACDSPRVRRLISAARVQSGTASGEDAGRGGYPRSLEALWPQRDRGDHAPKAEDGVALTLDRQDEVEPAYQAAVGQNAEAPSGTLGERASRARSAAR
jgi:putative FmdB family regulatory protein